MSLVAVSSDAMVHLPLYSGATVTLLQTLAKYLEWFTSHPGTSKSALSEMLELQSKILPSGNLLPKLYRAAYRIMEQFLVKPVTIHACQNYCILY